MKFLIKLFLITVIGLVVLRWCHHSRDPYETIKLQQERIIPEYDSQQLDSMYIRQTGIHDNTTMK